MTSLGEGAFRYRVEAGWGRLPPGWDLVEVAAVAVDTKDQIYVFNRGEHPMVVFDKHGNFLRSWGEGLFVRPHGLSFEEDGMLYCTDMGDHTVRRCTPEGEVKLVLGIPGSPSPFMSGKPFCRCTHSAMASNGDLYVSDGYGNAAVHHFDPGGKLLRSWGECGTEPGQFNVPHAIWCDENDWIHVVDRENHRIQVFDRHGRYETQWNNLHRPMALALPHKRCPYCFIAEAPPELGVNLEYPNLGPRVTITDRNGRKLARLGSSRPRHAPGEFVAPHDIAVDSEESIYVAEVSRTAWPRVFPQAPLPDRLITLQKFTRLGPELEAEFKPGPGVRASS